MTGKLLVVGLVAIMAVLAFALVAKYDGLLRQVRDACAQTEAAAKLNLGSLVPLCDQVRR